jgi:hypothetical protein
MGVGAGNTINYACLMEKGIQCLVFASPVSLHSKNFSVKQAFYKKLKLLEFLEHFRFVL